MDACLHMSRALSPLSLGMATNPTQTLRNLLGDPHIYAQMSTNTVAMYPCAPVKEYSFTISGICTDTPPVKFRMPHENEWSLGYLNPDTLIIPHEPRLQDCQLISTIMFSQGNQSLSYRSQTGNLTEVTQFTPLSTI